jgi:hypothetical protein
MEFVTLRMDLTHQNHGLMGNTYQSQNNPDASTLQIASYGLFLTTYTTFNGLKMELTG